MTVTKEQPETQADPPEVPHSQHLPRAVPEAWKVVGPVTPKVTRTAGWHAVGVEVHCLPSAGQLDAATAAARAAVDVSATVAADPRVVEAVAKRDRLLAALERDRSAVREVRAEADRHAADARAALVAGDVPDQFERLRDAATLKADKLAARVGELSELLAVAARDLERATHDADRDAKLAVRGVYQERLAAVAGRLSDALAADLAELWECQSVVGAIIR